MIELNATSLASLPEPVVRPRYDRSRVTAGIAHFSVGNFHRAHQAVYLDRCLHLAGQEGWGILGIGLLDDANEQAKARELPHQDHLYTLTEFPPAGPPTARVVGAVVEYLHAPADPARVLRRLCDPSIRIVSMTITEGGYNVDDRTGRFRLDQPAIQHDLANPGAPRTVFGFVAEALRRRLAEGVAPFTVLSCDNLRHNGDVARNAFLAFARARDPALADWMAEQVTFPNCMVDRITPATTRADAGRLDAANGVADALPVFSEDFIQWVVEDRFVSGRPALDAVGVQMTDAVQGYEQVKLRLLNASHSMLCLPGLLMGHRLVHEAMADPILPALLRDFMERDSIPLLHAMPGLDLHDYKDKVLARFGNPNIGDQLLRIASDCASKIPVFLQDTIRDAMRQGRDLERLAFAIACFARYLGGRDDRGEALALVEPHLSAEQCQIAATPGPGALALPPFEGWGLAEHPAFLEAYLRHQSDLDRRGTRAVLTDLVGAAR